MHLAREAGDSDLWLGPISNLFQAGEAHHTQGGTPSQEPLSPGPSECRGEGLSPEFQAQCCHQCLTGQRKRICITIDAEGEFGERHFSSQTTEA